MPKHRIYRDAIQGSSGARNAKTQRTRILRLLIDARGGWVSLPEIMACAAQYNARILELRRLGFSIENRTERVGGVRHSWFRLLNSPAPSAPEPVKEKITPTDSAASRSDDWYERQTGKPRSAVTVSIRQRHVAVRIQLFAKSFILQVCDVLARHNPLLRYHVAASRIVTCSNLIGSGWPVRRGRPPNKEWHLDTRIWREDRGPSCFDVSLANCYFAHDSPGYPVLLRFCDA